jgi:LemA protein
MKKGCLVGGGLLAILVVLGIWIMGIYNGVIPKDNAVKGQWGNVETAYQKRVDLVPNLVNTVKGAANFEQETLTQVMEARAKATQTTIDPTNLTPEKVAEFQQAQDGLSNALSRLMVVVERYPELKANQNFLSLQAELSSIESEVQFERKKFNTVTEDYNNYVRKAPNNLVVGLFGFNEKGYFKAAAGAENAPTVNF